MMTETATFAAGCFWGVEEALRTVPGVISTEVGYTGGHVNNPTYKQVCYEGTGHAEAVKLEFNPTKISYEELVRRFFELHDPTQKNRQGPDIGDQYRSAIFYHSLEQQQIAEKVKEELQETEYNNATIQTEITPASKFWRAEEYHQKYFLKNPDDPRVCQS